MTSRGQGRSRSDTELPEYVQDLITNGAREDIKKNQGWNLPMVVARYSNKYAPETVQKVIDDAVKVGSLNSQDADGWTPLMLASRFSREGSSIDTVKAIINAGADLDIREEKDSTALMLAIHVCENMSSLETVEALIMAGSSLDVKTKSGYSALDYVSKNAKTKILEMVVRKSLIGSNIGENDDAGNDDAGNDAGNDDEKNSTA